MGYFGDLQALETAGKAIAVALVLTAVGAATETGLAVAMLLLVAVGAPVLTLPVGAHPLARRLYRSDQLGSVPTEAE